MAFSRVIAAAAVLTALAVPAASGAAPRPAKSPRAVSTKAVAKAKAATPVSTATAVAERYWGAVPCNGQIKVVTQRPIATGLQSDSDAWVTFGSALGANDLAAPASSYASCTISLGSYRWPTTASMASDWDMLCLTMVHEFGHLLGHAHDTAPGSVMLPVFSDLSSEPQLCRTTRPKGA